MSLVNRQEVKRRVKSVDPSLQVTKKMVEELEEIVEELVDTTAEFTLYSVRKKIGKHEVRKSLERMYSKVVYNSPEGVVRGEKVDKK